MACQVYIAYQRGEAKDHDLAQGLCSDLRGIGAEVYCSDKDLSDASAMPEIYHAMGEAKILIVAGTSRDHMESQWVAHEWSKFQNAVLNGRKADGVLIAYIDSLEAKEVPFVFHDLPIFDSAHKGDLIGLVRNKLGIPEPPPKEDFSPYGPGLLFLLMLLVIYFILHPDSGGTQSSTEYAKIFHSVETSEYVLEDITDACPVSSLTSVDELSVGDHVIFGIYEQDGNSDNGEEPILWRVLTVENGRALLLSERLLCYRAYHDDFGGVTWAGCSLRRWLNGDFYGAAFDGWEQTQIALVTVRNPNNPNFGTQGGSVTRDRVFLLSSDEAQRYLSHKGDRVARTTDRAHARQYDYSNRSDDWWLRSPGRNAGCAATVRYDGSVSHNGSDINFKKTAVRPALWLEIP